MLDRTAYYIKEHVGFLKLSDTYDILDPETQQQIGIAKEKPSTLVIILRFLINKKLLPTQVFVYEGSDPENQANLLFSIRRGVGFLRTRVDILDENGQVVGFLKTKLISLGGAFTVYDAGGAEVATVKGDWKGRNFRFLDTNQNEIGKIAQQWAGFAKEMFTSADKYIISLNETPTPGKAILLLAAGLAVDTVLKETGE
ncbi:MAG: oxidoreductase [Planctomycetaceae bacterium]|nr:oxidoreductase [Planctomycetaceae bacterium]